MDTATVSYTTDSLKTIYERRAIRRYKSKTISKALIEEVIDAGRMAPSAMNHQPWHFYVLTDRELIGRLSGEISKTTLKEVVKSGMHDFTKVAAGLLSTLAHGDWQKLKDPVFHGAPVVIFLTASVNNEWAPLDTGMCAQNIMLAAKALGLDTCPVGFGKYVSHVKSYGLLHIPAGEQVLLAITLGYGDETPPVHERRKGNVLFIE